MSLSLDSHHKDRLDRSCHLTQKQYNIIVAYLSTGIKPPIETLEAADLIGNLNGGVNKSGRYHRLRSIASRLSLRPSDGVLVFASNGKIVIPSSKFVQTIKQAHRSPGDKHLNVTQTAAKLQETYTIGRRQFGMCEDQIREVVKSCNQGSCKKLKRKRTPSANVYDTVAKNFKVDGKEKSTVQARDKGSQLLEMLLGVNKNPTSSQATPSSYIAKQSPDVSESMNTSELNQINFGIQPEILTQNCLLVMNPVGPSSSLTDLKGFTNPSGSVNNNVFLIHPLGSVQASSAYNLAVQHVQTSQTTFGVQPQICSRLMFLQNITTPASNTVQLIYNASPVVSLPITSVLTENSLSDVNSFIDSFSSPQKNKSPVCSALTFLEEDNSDNPRECDLNNNDLELKWSTDFEPCQNGKEEIDTLRETNHNAIMIEKGDTDANLEEEKIPFPNIWHYYQDFSAEKIPFQKICIGIQDMKLDLMKGLVGDSVSTERLKKKISYLHELVQKEKVVTEPDRSKSASPAAVV